MSHAAGCFFQMKNDSFITNVLTLSAAGFLILLTGIGLYVLRDAYARYVRFFLPIPPLAVAAYIYVFNLFEIFKGDLAANRTEVVRDVLTSIIISGVFFSTFTILLIFLIHFLRRYFA